MIYETTKGSVRPPVLFHICNDGLNKGIGSMLIKFNNSIDWEKVANMQ
jgi:hypothetical protein